MLYNPLMKQAKKDSGQSFESITEFFMSSTQCSKNINGFCTIGYYIWGYIGKKCKTLKNVALPTFKNEHDVCCFVITIAEVQKQQQQQIYNKSIFIELLPCFIKAES